jgi:hypothetical protein
MRQSYPGFQCSCTQEELIEPFLLTPAGGAVMLFCGGAAKRCRMALLLKALSYLGYVPNGLAQIAPAVRTFIAEQLGLLWDQSAGRTRAELLFNAACERLRQACVELPAVGQFHRLVKAAVTGFYQNLYRRIAGVLAPEVRLRIDELLKVPDSVSLFERRKADTGKPSADNFQSTDLRGCASAVPESAAF